MAGNAYVLIMAGGGGTRLWPASRKRQPKQFLPILPGGKTLLGSTVERVQSVAPAERILVVTAANQVAEVERTAPSMPKGNIVIEPQARNTAFLVDLATPGFTIVRDVETMAGHGNHCEIRLEDVTPALARKSGFAGLVDLLKIAKHGPGERVFLVDFIYHDAV